MMETGKGLEILFTAIESAFLAQLIKFLTHLIKKRELDFSLLTTTGGMPSSHTAGVISLAVNVGLIEGFNSTAFAIAMGFAIVVMHDAAGLRRSAGKMAKTINKIVSDIYTHKTGDPTERLKELLGHTPFEVFGGAVWGIIITLVNHFYIFN